MIHVKITSISNLFLNVEASHFLNVQDCNFNTKPKDTKDTKGFYGVYFATEFIEHSKQCRVLG